MTSHRKWSLAEVLVLTMWTVCSLTGEQEHAFLSRTPSLPSLWTLSSKASEVPEKLIGKEAPFPSPLTGCPYLYATFAHLKP